MYFSHDGKGEAGGEEIASGQKPQSVVLAGGGCQRGAHGVDVQEAVYAPSVGEQVTQIPPRIGKHLLRPTDSGDKQEDE